MFGRHLLSNLKDYMSYHFSQAMLARDARCRGMLFNIFILTNEKKYHDKENAAC